VDNLDDFVDEDDDLLKELFGGLGELADLADGEDHVDLLAWDLELHEAFVVGESP